MRVLRSLVIISCLLSAPAGAVVITTLGGTTYTWMELSETLGQSRNEVALRLADSSDVLYGYEYASRAQMEQLLLSYSSWDGLNGYHGAPGVLTGVESILNDFGVTYTVPGDGVDSAYTTVDGYNVNYDGYIRSWGYYGLDGECGAGLSCVADQILYSDAAGTLSMANQSASSGWDANGTGMPKALYSTAIPEYGSYLVQVSNVPLPAAGWLLLSGLVALAGTRLRRKSGSEHIFR